MSCNHPYKGFYTGYRTEKGLDDFVLFTSTAGNMVSLEIAQKKKKPIKLYGDHIKLINDHFYLVNPFPIPCGVCSGCRKDHAKQWTTRLILEAQDYQFRTWFVTLTYEDYNLPANENGEITLNKEHVSEFMRKLRRNTSRKYRFFACGEYGGKTLRPHYHVVLFGDLDQLIGTGKNRFHSKEIADAWPYGLHEVSLASPKLLAYVAGYCNKKLKDPNWESYPVKPFTLMSRRPGIGAKYFDDHDVIADGLRVFGDFGNGVHDKPLPRYYKDKIKDSPCWDYIKARSIDKARLIQFSEMSVTGLSEEMLGDFHDLLDEKDFVSKERTGV